MFAGFGEDIFTVPNSYPLKKRQGLCIDSYLTGAPLCCLARTLGLLPLTCQTHSSVNFVIMLQAKCMASFGRRAFWSSKFEMRKIHNNGKTQCTSSVPCAPTPNGMASLICFVCLQCLLAFRFKFQHVSQGGRQGGSKALWTHGSEGIFACSLSSCLLAVATMHSGFPKHPSGDIRGDQGVSLGCLSVLAVPSRRTSENVWIDQISDHFRTDSGSVSDHFGIDFGSIGIN